jgi:hypothetical protein
MKSASVMQVKNRGEFYTFAKALYTSVETEGFVCGHWCEMRYRTTLPFGVIILDK